MNFWDHNRNYTNKTAVIDPKYNLSLTYKELFDEIKAVSKELNRSQKKLAFLFTENSYSAIIVYLSLLKSGYAVLLLESKLNEEIKNDLIERYNPELICTPQSEMYKNYDVLLTSHNYNLLNKKSDKVSDIFSETAVLLSTSGTTGSPKLVRLSYKNIQANAKSIVEYLKIDEKDKAITSLPMSYSYGLSVINSHLLAGASIVCTEKNILFRDFWDLFNEYKCTSFAGVPYTYQLLKKTGFEKVNLPTLKTMTQAGGRLDENLISIFREFAESRGIRFFVMYGQTEATARISYVPPENLANKIGSIGIPIPGGTIKLMTDDVEVTDEKSTGEIVYYGDNVMLGYAESRDDLKKGDELKGKLRTGDLAYKDSDGYFFVSGRLKRFIKIFGLRVNLDEIQKMIENHFGIPNACTGQDDLLKILVQTDDHLTEVNVKNEVIKMYKLNFKTVIVKPIDKIPTNSSGKYDYKKINELFN